MPFLPRAIPLHLDLCTEASSGCFLLNGLMRIFLQLRTFWSISSARLHSTGLHEFCGGVEAGSAALSKVRGGGFEPRFNPGSNSGAGSEGGEAEYQHQEPGFNPGSTQVQPRFNPGSTQVQPKFNPGLTQFEPRFNPAQVRTQVQPRFEPRFEPRFNPGSTQVQPRFNPV